MDEVAVGIDIGTSYTKGVARTVDGTVVAIYRKPSPYVKTDSSTGLRSASVWWDSLKDVMHGLLFARGPRQFRVKSICVSAIAPTLTVFDAAHPDSAFAILYSSIPSIKDGDSLSQSDPELTKWRLSVLRNVAHKEHLISPCITDLVGYANWRLTGRLTTNSISLAEMGMTQGTQDSETLGVLDNTTPRLVAPCEQIGETTSGCTRELGIQSGIPVCGGCPDTLSSILAAGITQSSERMLYLGTFGSILRLHGHVEALLGASNWRSPPFQWLLSVPGLGPEIELRSQEWFGSKNASDRLRMLDQAAAEAPPGADGMLFVVPRWKKGMTPVGKFELLPGRISEIVDVRRRARAVLEGIAYAALAVGLPSESTIIVGGGGARSRIWLDIISGALGRDVQARHMAWEATGTADIAAWLAWNSVDAVRPWYRSRANTEAFREIISHNIKRATEYYHEHHWL